MAVRGTCLVLVGDGRKPLLCEVEDDPVGLLGVPFPGLPAGTASARKTSKGAARPSKAILRSSTFSGGRSAVDPALSGRPSTSGRGSGTGRMLGLTSGATGLSLARFLGALTKVTKWPRLASCSESSRKGVMWPKASHENTTMCRGEDSCLLDFCHEW